MKINNTCPNCNIEFLSEKRDRRKFCSKNCSASFNNKNRNRKKSNILICLSCNKEFNNARKDQKFCSFECMGRYKAYQTYQKLLNGNISSSNSFYNPRGAKRFILEEQNKKCAICDIENIWNEKSIVFVLDHIDGNSTNNKRENLRLVCPNCDSQLSTFKSRNKNSGRYLRKQRYLEGKSF